MEIKSQEIMIYWRNPTNTNNPWHSEPEEDIDEENDESVDCDSQHDPQCL